MALCVLQRDAEDLRAQLRAVRADMTAAAQRAEAEHKESLFNLCQVQSEADAQACSNLLTRISCFAWRDLSRLLSHVLSDCHRSARVHTYVSDHVQVTEVKRQASRALKHLRQQLLAARQQHEALQVQVPACDHVTRPCAEHPVLPHTLQAPYRRAPPASCWTCALELFGWAVRAVIAIGNTHPAPFLLRKCFMLRRCRKPQDKKLRCAGRLQA